MVPLIALTSLVLIVGVSWFLMSRGWSARRARDERFGSLPPVPESLGEVLRTHQGGPASWEGYYVSTTTAGDWLDRVAKDGVGNRAAARLTAYTTGVLIERAGERDVFIPAKALVSAELAPGMAGKFVEADGLAVIRWSWKDIPVDTGFRIPGRTVAQDATHLLVDTVNQLRQENGSTRPN